MAANGGDNSNGKGLRHWCAPAGGAAGGRWGDGSGWKRLLQGRAWLQLCGCGEGYERWRWLVWLRRGGAEDDGSRCYDWLQR
ncbi:hypothetical protein BHM03_00039208 [Ensete ventricosum]|nr:hypothetical protein BHM03_00039208 [Ensete ventricosum]